MVGFQSSSFSFTFHSDLLHYSAIFRTMAQSHMETYDVRSRMSQRYFFWKLPFFFFFLSSKYLLNGDRFEPIISSSRRQTLKLIAIIVEYWNTWNFFWNLHRNLKLLCALYDVTTNILKCIRLGLLWLKFSPFEKIHRNIFSIAFSLLDHTKEK